MDGNFAALFTDGFIDEFFPSVTTIRITDGFIDGIYPSIITKELSDGFLSSVVVK